MEIISIDQNCHPLWDVPPKLHALAHAGYSTHHCIEDIDVAFTAIGAQAGDDDTHLRVARERFYRSGAADWGAAIFYFCFLGRQPVEIRQLAQFTGMKTSALAGRLGCSVDDLYDRFSPSDNWQLIGPSYFQNRDLHRVIGDLSVSQTSGFLGEIIDIARDDMLKAFPSDQSQKRVERWIDDQRKLLAELISADGDGTLVELYDRWLGRYVKAPISMGMTSDLLACGRDEAQTALLEVFTCQYETAGELYNAAITETHQPLRLLDLAAGELPFFATIARQGRMVRCGVSLLNGGLQIADMHFDLLNGGRIPVDKLRDAGIIALAGKAMLLVIQVRIGPAGRALGLPYRGSLYMPAAVRLAEKLQNAGLLPGQLQPIIRVRLGFMDALKNIDTPIRLPNYLQGAMNAETVPAHQLGETWRQLASDAADRLKAFATPQGRIKWREQTQSQRLGEIADIDQARRELARTDPKGPEIRNLSKRSKQLGVELLNADLEQIATDIHTAELDYWDSRGAILPWSIALGGQEFYDDLIANAKIYEEA